MLLRSVALAVLIGVLIGALSAPAGARAQPAPVMEAYGDYVDALQGGDRAAAREAALRALSLAETALQAEPPEIGAAEVAILAENAGEILLLSGEPAEARARFLRAAGLIGEDGPALAGARNMRRAAEAALTEGDVRDARRFARDAAERLDDVPQDAERDSEYARAKALEARGLFESGLLRNAGRAGAEAVEAALRLPDAPAELSIGLAAFYAAVSDAFNDRKPDAAYHLEIADRIISAAVGPQNDLAVLVGGWKGYLRDDELGQAEQERVDARIDALVLPPEVDRPDPFQAVIDLPGYVEAQPVSRPAPTFPRDAFNLRIEDTVGLEGVALVEFTVAADGAVRDIRTIGSFPIEDFGQAAERAMRRWRYEPARVNGEPVDRPGLVTQFTFVIRN